MTDPLLEGLPDAGNDPLLGGLPDQPRPARPAILRAGQHQPDQYVEAARRGATLGVPTDVVLRNGDQTRQMEIERSLEGLRKSNPELADWLLAGDNLTVAQDDVPTLGKVASGVQSVAKYLAAPQRGLNQGVGSGISGLGDLLDAGAYGLARLTGGEDAAAQYDREARASSTNPSNWLRALGDWVSDGGLLGTMAQMPADATGVRNPFTPLEAGESNTTLAVLEGLGNLTGQAVATAANPTAGLAMLLGQGADQQADMARAAGAEGTGEAYAAIAASAPVAAALNKIGLDRILKHAPPGIQNSVARYITDKLAAAGVEATTEAAEQVAYNALAQSTYNPNQSLTEGVRENFEVGGLVGGIARVLVGARYARTRTEQEGAVLDALTTDAAASRLRQRDPERFRELVAGMTQTGADKVYVNAEAALTYFQSAGIEPSTLVNAEELSEAVALGGDIAIPMADYLTKIAPDHHAGLSQFARLTPGGMTRADLATFDEQAEAAAQRFLSSVDEAAGAESDVRVYQDVLGQLLGTGMDRSVAEKNAALMQSVFRSLAQRSGRDAADLYQQYGLRIVQEQPEALSVLRRTPNIEATVDSLLDRLSAGDIPTEAAALGQSLVEWLAGSGGVTDPVMTGELRRLNESDRVNRRGKARLVRPDAKWTLDYAREAAAEAGYLPMDSTVNDLLDAITEEVDGGRAIRMGGNPELSNLRAALMEADSLLGRAGIDPADRDAARRYLLGGGEFDQQADQPAPATDQVFYQDALPDADLVATLRARIAELERELRTDKLTGMRNRAAFDEDEALGWPNVAVLDLDGLKAVNDDVGHAAGDELLRKAAEVMLAAESDSVRFYRQGGDEYTARFADGVDAEAVMREVRDRLSSVDVVMETDDGLQIYRGIGAGYGIGPDFKTADARQNADKERRVATGERAPRGLSRAADRLVGLAQGRQVADRQEQGRAGEPGAQEDGLAVELNQSDRMAEAIRRGYIKFAGDRKFTVGLTENADLSTFLHESAHFFLEVMGDLAADPNVPETIAQDYAVIVRWLGVSSRAEIGTEQHEKFARGFERYLGEGKAPTPELEGAFVRFRAWIKAIYKTLTALNVELTDEVRGVFDRMVAGDEAITRAEQAADMEPLFKEAAAAGMTEARFREYLRLQAAGREEAEARIARRAVEEVSRERKQWWREESESVQREVEAELGAQPVYQAWANLARGTLPDGSPLPEGVEAIKLDKGWLLERYGQEFLNKNLRRRNVYAVEGGQDGDVVAAMFGYSSGDELVTALANAVPYKAAVRAETLARMRERHGDLRMDPKLPETAMRAVHNDKRMKAIEADVRVLEELTSTPRMDARAVRRWAEGKVGRTRLRDLTPSAYLRAERKAAREAIRAAAAGDMAGALTAQRRRLANAHLYDLAAKAVEEGERIRRYVKRFDKKALRARLGKVDRLTQADALLQQYDFARASGREIDRGKARGELLAAIEAGEITAPRSVVERLGAPTTNWRDVPMDDLRGFRDVLKQFEAQARAEYETLVNGQRRLVEDDANAVAESISRKGTRIDLSLSGDDLGDSARRTAREALSAWLRPSEIARQLDSGDDYGPMTRLVIEPVRRAYSETLEPMLHKARQDVSDLYRKHYTLPELGKFGQRRQIAPLKGAYTKAELLALALNWGNADNRQAVLDSMVGGQRPMTEPGVLQAFRENLDARDWAFVQDVWQYLDTYWPQAKAVEQRRKGVTPKKVQPTPFQVQTADGQTLDIAGGYYRLKYNPSKDSRVAKDEVEDLFKRVMVGGHVSSSTRAGSQNERVGSAGRPVWLDLSVIDSHLTEVIRDIALSEPVAHVYKVMNSAPVRQAMTLTGNKPVEATLERWLKDAAAGELAAQGFLEKSTAWLRTGFSKSKMAWKATTMLLQFTGVFQTAVVVGKANFAAGAGRWMQNPRKWHQHIMAESAFMRTRYELQAWNKDVQDTRTFLNAMAGPTPTRVKQAIDAISATYFLPLAKSQMLVDEMTWMAGYHKGVNERGLGHDDAILYADSVVENAQTSGLFSDRSALERGTINNRAVQSQFIRIWTTLGSYMIAKGNIAYGRAREVVRRPTVPNIANFATDMVLLFMVEAVAGMLIRGNWPDDEDETEVAKSIAGETVASVMGTVPFVRELPSAKYGSGNTPIGAFVGDAYKAGYQVSQGELDPQAIKAVNNLGGTLFHYPSAQMNVLVDSYWADQVEGQDVSPYEYVVTGPKE